MRAYKWRLEVGKMTMYLGIPVFCFLVYKLPYMQDVFLTTQDKQRLNPELYVEESPWKALREINVNFNSKSSS